MKPTIPDADVTWRAVRASGPGGQNVNKVASKVELRFDLPGTRVLDEEAKARLRVLAGNRFDADGALIITSQLTRDQAKNLADARAKLDDLVERARVRPKKRRPTKPTKGSRERRLREKAVRGKIKAGRGSLGE